MFVPYHIFVFVTAILLSRFTQSMNRLTRVSRPLYWFASALSVLMIIFSANYLTDYLIYDYLSVRDSILFMRLSAITDIALWIEVARFAVSSIFAVTLHYSFDSIEKLKNQ